MDSDDDMISAASSFVDAFEQDDDDSANESLGMILDEWPVPS